MNLKAY
jgi:hypothetical protein